MFHYCSIHCNIVNNLLPKEKSQCHSLANKYCIKKVHVSVLCNPLSVNALTAGVF